MVSQKRNQRKAPFLLTFSLLLTAIHRCLSFQPYYCKPQNYANGFTRQSTRFQHEFFGATNSRVLTSLLLKVKESLPQYSRFMAGRIATEHFPERKKIPLSLFFNENNSALSASKEEISTNSSLFNIRKRLQKILKNVVPFLRKTSVKLALAAFILTSFAQGSLAASSSGRMGGSFGPSSSGRTGGGGGSYSTPRSRPMTGAPIRIYPNPSPPVVIMNLSPPTPRFVYSRYDAAPARSFSAGDVALLTATGGLIAYGFRNNFRKDGETGPLGPGACFSSITVSLDVPNRDDPNCILERLRRLAERTDMSTRKSVQNLVTEVSLELLRQGNTIVSASTESSHYKDGALAQREFQRQSIQDRSEFDRETINNFGGRGYTPTNSRFSGDSYDLPKSTSAIVTINLAIGGDSTMLTPVRFRQEVLNSLSRIASDAQVEDCLLSAEILWAPEERRDSLSRNDIYAMYPKLIPL